MSEILTYTMNPAIDMSISVQRVTAGRKLRGDEPRYDPGGGGINVSRVLHRLGHPAAAFYPSGGPTGELLSRLLEQEDIPHRPIAADGWVRQNVVVTEKEDGQQYRFGVQGPELSQKEWTACLDAQGSFSDPLRFVAGSGSLPPGVPDDFYARLARQTRNRKGLFFLDTHGAALKNGLCDAVYLVKLNHRELQELLPGEFRDEHRIVQGGRQVLQTYGCEHVAISLGSGGAMLISAGEVRKYQAPQVTINSRIGAGDSMLAGIIAGLARGMDIGRAMVLGVAAGSAAVLTPGTELCRKADVERLFDTIKQKTS